jgi:hypothetical protein
MFSTISCEIVALRENFVDRPESYDLLSAKKVVYFLRTKKRARFGVYISITIHNMTQNKVSKNS